MSKKKSQMKFDWQTGQNTRCLTPKSASRDSCVGVKLSSAPARTRLFLCYAKTRKGNVKIDEKTGKPIPVFYGGYVGVDVTFYLDKNGKEVDPKLSDYRTYMRIDAYDVKEARIIQKIMRQTGMDATKVKCGLHDSATMLKPEWARQFKTPQEFRDALNTARKEEVRRRLIKEIDERRAKQKKEVIAQSYGTSTEEAKYNTLRERIQERRKLIADIRAELNVDRYTPAHTSISGTLDTTSIAIAHAKQDAVMASANIMRPIGRKEYRPLPLHDIRKRSPKQGKIATYYWKKQASISTDTIFSNAYTQTLANTERPKYRFDLAPRIYAANRARMGKRK